MRTGLPLAHPRAGTSAATSTDDRTVREVKLEVLGGLPADDELHPGACQCGFEAVDGSRKNAVAALKPSDRVLRDSGLGRELSHAPAEERLARESACLWTHVADYRRSTSSEPS